MSSELEARLERLLAELAEPGPHAGERALAAALAALPGGRPQRRRRPRTLLLLPAAALALLALSAVALAAAGALHVSIGQPSRPRTAPVPSRLAVPRGANGIAAVLDGRLWLATSSGLRIEGLPVSAATLSPRALYVAAGIGNSLVAMAPDGRRAWSRPTAGPVAAIAWAPDGLEIAYIVQARRRFRLHLIEGNGGNDQLVDDAVRPVTPSWRSDSLALAYVAAGGSPVLYDLGHHSRRLLTAIASRDASRLAFSPRGNLLAIASSKQLWLAGSGHPTVVRDLSPETIAGLGWLRETLAVAANPPLGTRRRPRVRLFEIAPGGRLLSAGALASPAAIRALDSESGMLTLAVTSSGHGMRLLTSLLPARTASAPLAQAQTLLELPRPTTIRDLTTR